MSPIPSKTSSSDQSEPSATGEIVARLFSPDRPPPPLEPGTAVWEPALVRPISGLREHRFVVAALHLANDDIHHAHLIAQDDEGDPTADLLHATLHRREGDYWNSKYWFSHIRAHPLVPDKASAKAFVDACERAARGGGAGRGAGGDDEALRVRQWAELRALVEWTRANCK